MNEHRAVSEISLGQTGTTVARFAFGTEYITTSRPRRVGNFCRRLPACTECSDLQTEYLDPCWLHWVRPGGLGERLPALEALARAKSRGL
ncbi:MAG TPA: hypothetical protein GX513_00185, partial [Firmicutes bacterium]|nr:hypothetical protein [Bacillota bacterium]